MHSTMPSPADNASLLAEADDEAARSILAEATWQEVHDVWERRTHLVLSPHAFGERIVPVVEKHRAAQHQMSRQPSSDRRHLPPVSQQQQQQQQPPPHHPARHSMDVRAMTNGRYSSPPPPPAPANGVGTPRMGQPDSLTQHRAEINRIDAAVANLQNGMQELRGMMQQLRHDILSRSPRSRPDDATALDLLSETVTGISHKTGEIDGLKLNVASVTRRVKLLEEANGTPQTPSLPDASFPRPGSTASQFPPAQQAMPARPAQPPQPPAEARAWNAVNAAKRKSPSEADGYDMAPNGVPKRPRPLHEASADRIIQHQQQPAPPPSAGVQGPPTLAPIRSMSNQGSPPEPWRPAPEPHRLPPLQGLPPSRGGHPPTHGGRPNIPEPIEVPPPPPPPPPPQQQQQQQAWDRDAWEDGRMSADYYGRPMPGGIAVNPADRRGAIMRRGGGAGLQYMDPNMPTKRTRQRPVRNADGILIRKDGKPDQRSISSPQNLRKVHARKMAEQEASRTAGSPLSHEHGSQDEGSDGSEFSSPQDDDQTHKDVMERVFPHGVEEDEAGHGLTRRRATQIKADEEGGGDGDEAMRAGEERSSNASGGSRRTSTSTHSNPMEVDSEPQPAGKGSLSPGFKAANATDQATEGASAAGMATETEKQGTKDE